MNIHNTNWVFRSRSLPLAVIATALALFFAPLEPTLSASETFGVHQSLERLKAEYLAKSGLNLSRLMIVLEPEIRRASQPMSIQIQGIRVPQLDIEQLINCLLPAFSTAADGHIGVEVVTENELLNVTPMLPPQRVVSITDNELANDNPIPILQISSIITSLAMQIYAHLGGYQMPDRPTDALFETPDSDGHISSRLDIISAIIDWNDFDQERTTFDPSASELSTGGREDNIYETYDDPYSIKNAPFDSLQELRLIRGIGDDFWTTFVQSDPDDPKTRKFTIYGSGKINVNQAKPEVLNGRLCKFDELAQQPFCIDPIETVKFHQTLDMARTTNPTATFDSPKDFIDFVEGKGDSDAPYPTLEQTLGSHAEDFLFTPLQIPDEILRRVEWTFVAAATTFSIYATGMAAGVKVRMNAVANFHNVWTPPPPNTGTLPRLGIIYYYRIDS